MKILIVGVCGFVGSHLALYLSQQGYKVSVSEFLKLTEGVNS
jgi:nucleoside-diphosphate-sugar epimerase